MLATFDVDLGPEVCRCHLKIAEDRCHGILDFSTVTADRIDPGGTYRRENVQPACTPCQTKQGALTTNAARRAWVNFKEEAEARGIEWDGVM